jgi:hypothetical protein
MFLSDIYNIIYIKRNKITLDKGGHFAAREQLELFTIHAAFRLLR